MHSVFSALFHLHNTMHGMVGWRFRNRRSSLVIGSLTSFDQLGKTGWGQLMCNMLLCPNDYSQHATEQGRHCVSGRAKLSGLEPLLDPYERITHKLLTQILCCWIKLHWLSNHFPVLQLSHTWSVLGLAAHSCKQHGGPNWLSSQMTIQFRVRRFQNLFQNVYCKCQRDTEADRERECSHEKER